MDDQTEDYFYMFNHPVDNWEEEQTNSGLPGTMRSFFDAFQTNLEIEQVANWNFPSISERVNFWPHKYKGQDFLKIHSLHTLAIIRDLMPGSSIFAAKNPHRYCTYIQRYM